MEWHTVVRTCRPEKPGVGLTRQCRSPTRTHEYYMKAARERDLLWFNWQLRETVYHVKNYRNQRKHWLRLIKQLWTKYRMHYRFLTYTILSYLDYDKLPTRNALSMPPPMGYFDNLNYATCDISRVCRNMGNRLFSMGYPKVLYHNICEMDVYLSYYSSTLFFMPDIDYFRFMYIELEKKEIKHSWRIIYSHMLVLGYGGDAYDYREGHLYLNYRTKRSDHYFKLWVKQNRLTGEPLALVTSWFERMKRPSIRGSQTRNVWMDWE